VRERRLGGFGEILEKHAPAKLFRFASITWCNRAQPHDFCNVLWWVAFRDVHNGDVGSRHDKGSGIMSKTGGAFKEALGRLINDREMMEEGHLERHGVPGHHQTDGEHVEATLGHALDESRAAHARREHRSIFAHPEDLV
jgi:hypothetical protein